MTHIDNLLHQISENNYTDTCFWDGVYEKFVNNIDNDRFPTGESTGLGKGCGFSSFAGCDTRCGILEDGCDNYGYGNGDGLDYGKSNG